MGDSSTVVDRSIRADVKSCHLAKGQGHTMAIIHRRVFQAKVGQSAPRVEHFQEAVKTMKSHGINWDTRISSDYHSGRSDRVSVEWLLDELSDIDADSARVMEIPEAATFLGAWLEKMNDMIHHADVENWTVHQEG